MYCCTPQSALQSCWGGGGLFLNHTPGCRSTGYVRLPQDNGTSALPTAPSLQGEKREEERIIETIKCSGSPHPVQVERREHHRANQVAPSPTHQYRWEERVRESLEPIKWGWTPTHQLSGGEGRGEIIEPIKWMRSPHTSYRWRGERVIEPIKWMRSPHTSYRWRGGESHRANQVYALTTPATGGEERES